MEVKWWIYVVGAVALLQPIGAAKILAFLPFLGQSHFVMFNTLLEELNKRGHDIVAVSPFPRKTPLENYRDISLQGIVPFLNNKMEIESFQGPFIRNFFMDTLYLYWLLESYEDVFKVKEVQEVISGKEKFDLVLTELFNTDMFLGVPYKLGLPFVALSSSPPMPWSNARFGNPSNPVYSDGIFSSGAGSETFAGRLANALGVWTCTLAYSLFFEPYSQRMAEKYLGPLPPLTEIAKNTSLFLVNTHFSLHQPKPLVPAIVEVGGLHIQPPRKLPQELEKFLNNSKDGVIYFSMGSVLRGESWSTERRAMFINAFSKLKQNVLWKWEGDDIPNKPKNVFISKWIPQREVLAHPNVVLYITHGGLFGITEAVYSGVPILGIPVFGDQPLNVGSVKKAGAGLSLDFGSFDESELTKSLDSLLNNPQYKENAAILAEKFKDRQSSAMDTAVYWIEYVIRQKGAHHLRIPAANLSWYQFLLLDVIAALLLAALGIASLLYFVVRILLSLICYRRTSKTKKS